MSYVFGLTGSTNLTGIQKAVAGMAGAPASPALIIGLLFMIVGLGFKVAIVPFHLWAPDAYEAAPTPVAAYIATGSKVASFYVLAKVLVVGFGGLAGLAFWGHVTSGWALMLAILATMSMILGNVAAIVQSNIKRLLAYSSIAHAGYIFVALAAASGQNVEPAVSSVLFYVIIYGLTNIGAFGVVTVLGSRLGGENLEHFDGMAKRAPLLSLLMLIFVLSLAGIPPLSGFFGKFYLFAVAVRRDPFDFGLLWLVVVAIMASAVSLYYYLIVLKHFYVIKSKDESPISTPAYVNVTLVLVAVAVIGLGVFPQRLIELISGLLKSW
jgi:NADH-quinone oxidoreductase subunit N